MDYFYPFAIWVVMLLGVIAVGALGLMLALRLQRIHLRILDEAVKQG